MRTEIKRALLLMERAMRYPKVVDKDLVDVWQSVLADAGVDAQDVQPAYAAIIKDQPDFPSPSEFILVCNGIKRRREFAARALEIQPPPELKEPKALPAPMTPEQRSDLAVRFDAIHAKFHAPLPTRKYPLEQARRNRAAMSEPTQYPDEKTPEQVAAQIEGARA